MRLRRTTLAVTAAAVALAPLSMLAPTVAAAGAAPSDGAWHRVYRHDFRDMRDVTVFQSSSKVNSGIRGSDRNNSALQKPSVASNVGVVADRGAGDGRSLAVHTRKATYRTTKGTKAGWTNGRMMIRNHDQSPPVRIKTRLRLTPSAKTKTAVMWWPARGGWKWEVDFVETFGGHTTRDYWGSRRNITQRWHGDVNGDGRAVEQLVKDIAIDATKYHVYDLFVTPSRMWIKIDGVTRYQTTDRRFIPHGPGFFSIGKALSHRRDEAGRTPDAAYVDYVEIYKSGK